MGAATRPRCESFLTCSSGFAQVTEIDLGLLTKVLYLEFHPVAVTGFGSEKSRFLARCPQSAKRISCCGGVLAEFLDVDQKASWE